MNNDELFLKADKHHEKKNFSLAYEYFLQAAKQGDSGSMSRLACMYSHAEGVPLDYNKAIEWDLKAISQGEISSMFNLAITYRIIGELIQSKHWFEKSLDSGNGEAALALAKLYMISSNEFENIRRYLQIASEHKWICEESRIEAIKLLSDFESQ